MVMAYTGTPWNSGDPITQDRMNKIEKGIEDAHSSSTAAANKANEAKTKADTNAEKIGNLETAVGNLQTKVTQNASFGEEAIT
jgi:hypothetical protein